MIDSGELPTSTPRPIERGDVYFLLHRAFETTGRQRARFLRKALCALAIVVGVDAFTIAMRDSADELLKDDSSG